MQDKGSNYYKIHFSEDARDSEPSEPLKNVSSVVGDEDGDLRPHELSGDENGEQSILATVTDSSKSPFFLSVTTIIKTVIGSGILTIPYTTYRLGFLMGILLFFGAAFLNQFASLLLLKSKNLSGHSNYATIFYNILPSKFSKGFGSIIILITNMGVCIAELIIFKTSIRKIIEDVSQDPQLLEQFYTKPFFIVLVMAALLLPLTLASKIQKLKLLGLSGVIGIVIYMVTFVIFYILCSVDQTFGKPPVGNMRKFPDDWYGAAAAVPNIIFSISFQNNFFPIFKGMRNSSDKKMMQASFTGGFFCATSYLLVGILGYNLIGEGVQANFLESFVYEDMSKPFFYILNSTFLISIFFAFPIMFFGARNNFIALIKVAFIKENSENRRQWRHNDSIAEISSYIKGQELQKRKKKARLHFMLYTFFIYAVMIGIALGVDDIEVVFNILGGITVSAIAPILPCIFYVALVHQKKKDKGIKFYAAIVVFCIMIPYSLFSVVSLYV